MAKAGEREKERLEKKQQKVRGLLRAVGFV